MSTEEIIFFDDSGDEFDEMMEDHFRRERELIAMAALQVGQSSRQHGVSVVGRRYKNRRHSWYNGRLLEDYFVPNPTYTDGEFRRRFRMRQPLFLRILQYIEQHDKYFFFKPNASRTQGLTGIQKMTAALRMLAYVGLADTLDENLHVAESTVLECLEHFYQAIVDIYGDQYLRRPNEADISRLMNMHGSRGWPRMLGSIDCMHWEWKNCPKAYAGAYQGMSRRFTIILEAIASYDLWIWHAFFGMPGSNSDLNVVERSTLSNDLANGRSTPYTFSLGGNTYDHGYYPGDGIYPKWSTIVKTIPNPQNNKQSKFAAMQEGRRKDVQRAFGVLQSRFAIVSNPCMLWSADKMIGIMYTCVILHNMILEDERDMEEDYVYEGAPTPPNVWREDMIRSAVELEFHVENQMLYRNVQLHRRLRDDLIDHLWNFSGTQ